VSFDIENLAMNRFPFLALVARASGATKDGPRRERRRTRVFRPSGVEAMEGRALLSTVIVHVVSDAFNASPVTVHVGDTVHWVWDAGPHSTTSVMGSVESWDSGVHGAGFTFDHTFKHAGSFAYYCTIHGVDNGNGTASGMAGMVVVASASATLRSLAVAPAGPHVHVGTTQQFVAIGAFSDGSTRDLTSQVVWSSATPTVATISGTGLAHVLKVGTSVISASLNGMTGSTVLHADAPAPVPAPRFLREMRHFTGVGARRRVDGFMLFFSGPLDAGTADNVSHYQVTQPGLTPRSRPIPIAVRSALFNRADNSVMLMLGNFNLAKPLVLMASGLIGAGGAHVSVFITEL
jgi:plastocyanin